MSGTVEEKSLLSRLPLSLQTSVRALLPRLARPIAIFFGCLVILSSAIASLRIPLKGSDANLDQAWEMAFVHTFQQGELLGRDIFFNYGPLIQLLYWLVSRLGGDRSAFDSLAITSIFQLALSVACIGLALLLIRQVSWRYALFCLLTLTVLNMATDILYYRGYLHVVEIVILTRALAAATARSRLLGVGLAGVVAFLMQLITFEMGLYALAYSLVLLALYALLARFKLLKVQLPDWRSFAGLALVFGSIYLAGNLLISFFFKLTSPDYAGFFDYQLMNLEIVRGYSSTFGSAWYLHPAGTIALFLLFIYCLVQVILLLPRLEPAQGYLLAGLLVAAPIQFKSATVRSDIFHIAYASVSFFFLFLLLGLDWPLTAPSEDQVSGRMGSISGFRIKWGWLGLGFLLLVTWPLSTFQPLQQFGRMLDREASVGGIVQQALERRTPLEDISPAGMAGAADPAKAIMSFPYEYQMSLGLSPNKKTLNPILSTYAAHTSLLQRKFVEGMERNKPQLEIIYGMDELVPASLDGVQSITRLPLIFENIYQNFEPKVPETFDKGYLLLQSRSEQRSDLEITNLPFRVEERNASRRVFRLEQPATCSLVRLSPTITLPVYSLLGRPPIFVAEFMAESQAFLTTGLVNLDPGQPFSTYIGLVDPQNFKDIFGSAPVQQKTFDRLVISDLYTGYFQVSSSSFDLNRLECINFKR